VDVGVGEGSPENVKLAKPYTSSHDFQFFPENQGYTALRSMPSAPFGYFPSPNPNITNEELFDYFSSQANVALSGQQDASQTGPISSNIPQDKYSASSDAPGNGQEKQPQTKGKGVSREEEIQPKGKRCRYPGCGKDVKRAADLTQHEKTHYKPFKCLVESCKYHECGWSRKSDLDHHYVEEDMPLYECPFKPCPYKPKRESRLKHHMVKKHGWEDVSSKNTGGEGG
jgi:hypothetical protein